MPPNLRLLSDCQTINKHACVPTFVQISRFFFYFVFFNALEKSVSTAKKNEGRRENRKRRRRRKKRRRKKETAEEGEEKKKRRKKKRRKKETAVERSRNRRKREKKKYSLQEKRKRKEEETRLTKFLPLCSFTELLLPVHLLIGVLSTDLHKYGRLGSWDYELYLTYKPEGKRKKKKRGKEKN